MFSAAFGGFNYVTAAIGNSNRITVVTSTAAGITGSSNNQGLIIDGSYNCTGLYQTGSAPYSYVLYSITPSGSVSFNRIFAETYTSGFSNNAGGLCVNPANGDLFFGIAGQTGASTSGARTYQLSNTGTTTSSSGVTTLGTYVFPAAGAVDTVNSSVYFLNPTDYNGTGYRIFTNTTSLSNMAINASVQHVDGTSAQVPVACGFNSNNTFIFIANSNSNATAVVSAMATPLSSSSTPSGRVLSLSGKTVLYAGLANDSSANTYCVGWSTNTGIAVPMIAKFSESGAALTLQWTKTITAVGSTTAKATCVTVASNGNIIMAYYQDLIITFIAFDSTGAIVWQTKFTITTSGATIYKPVTIKSDASKFYVAIAPIVSSKDEIIYVTLPIDGSIPGSGSYTVGTDTFTYATATNTIATLTYTNASRSSTFNNIGTSTYTYTSTNSSNSSVSTTTATL
jgi:hypothetical protein